MQFKFIFIPLFLAFFLFTNFSVLAQTKEIDSLLAVLSETKTDTAKVRTLRALSVAFTSVDVDRKFDYAKQYLRIAEKNHIDSLIPMAYIDMGMKYGIKTEYDSAMFYFAKGLKTAKRKNVQSQIARAYVNIGYTFDRLDNPQASIENYKLALQIFKNLNHNKGINQTYINLGSLYYDNKEYKIADNYFKEALKMAEKSKNEGAIAQGYFNIGGTSFKLGRDKDAYKYYLKSLEMREKSNDLNGIALANWGLGELFSKQGKFVEAKKLLDLALKNNQITENKYQETAVLITISRNYLWQNNYLKAEEIAQQAFSNAKSMNSKTIAVLTLELLVEINSQGNNYKKAFDYLSQSMVIGDSLNIEKAKNEFIFKDFQRIQSEITSLEKSNEVISNMNLSYKKVIITVSSLFVIVLLLLVLYLLKAHQKTKVNTILNIQKSQISKINEELENLNEELKVQNEVTMMQKEELARINAVKNKFFSIVSHDLRSPIATLKMLFDLYSSGQVSREEMDVLLKKLEENIYNTADFLDNLLEWSKSQLEGMVLNPELFLVKNLAQENLKILNSQILAKKLVVENNIDEKITVFADKNMINVVLRNLLSNSIKFCIAEDSIILSSTIKDENLILSIKDTGIGIDAEEQKKIFHLEHTISEGTSGEKGHQIGLVLCKDMVEQNGGKIWFESTLDYGTAFFIELPTSRI